MVGFGQAVASARLVLAFTGNTFNDLLVVPKHDFAGRKISTHVSRSRPSFRSFQFLGRKFGDPESRISLCMLLSGACLCRFHLTELERSKYLMANQRLVFGGRSDEGAGNRH
jgi:hypothetical protein